MHDDHPLEHGHPKDRPLEADDPMQLDAVEVHGDPAVMLDCLVEEFARIGWDAEMILSVFTQPFYAGTYGLNVAFGEAEIRRRVARTLDRCGTMRFRAVEHVLPPEFSDPPPLDEDAQAAREAGTRVMLTVGGRPMSRA